MLFRRHPQKVPGASPANPAVAAATPEAAAWRRAHAGSGVTSGLILAYVEREAGRPAVDEMLVHAGLSEREPELRDENSWLSFEEKIRLWAAAEAVTGDTRIAVHVGESVLELRVGLALKRALRALGSPDLVYRNVVRANSKFNWAHTLQAAGRGPGRVELLYRDNSGVGYHHYDCDYTTGLLGTIPQLFGLPRARVTHVNCGARGDECCEFEVTWSNGQRSVTRFGVAAAGTAFGLGFSGLLVDVPTLGFAGLGCATLAAGAATRWTSMMRRRVNALETAVRDQELATDGQLESFAALSSELRVDRALERITHSAGAVIVGSRFALLIAEQGRMRAEVSSSIPAHALARLERWAQDNQKRLRRGPIVVDRLVADPALRPLADDRELPLGSACAVPLLFHDELLGALIALTPGETVFLPSDSRSLEIYASHAAIALWNAQLVDRLEHEASEDPLTGLANRRSLSADCLAEGERAERENAAACLVMLDIDHFKQINDTYGHSFGDEVLIQVAQALRAAVRPYDTVARIGGEEFALLLPSTEIDEALEIAERARQLISTIELPDGLLSCSAGVAPLSGLDRGESDMLAAADRALYEAKRQGRDRTVLATAATTCPEPSA